MNFNDPKSPFIKSFSKLRKIQNLTLAEANFIELVLSYTDNGQCFYMSDKEIGRYLMMKEKSVNNLVSKLKKKNFIDTNTESNNKKGYGGSTRYITINLELLYTLIITPEPTEKLIDTNNKKQAPSVRQTIETKDLIIFDYPENEGGDLISDEDLAQMMLGNYKSINTLETEKHGVENNISEPDILSSENIIQYLKQINKDSERFRSKSSYIDYVLENHHILDEEGLKHFYDKIMIEEMEMV